MNKSYILIDNNLLRKVYAVSNGDILFSNLYQDSLVKRLPDIRLQEAVVTPYSLLEAIGFGEIPSSYGVKIDGIKTERAHSLVLKEVSIKAKIKRHENGIIENKPTITDDQYQTLLIEQVHLQKQISNLLGEIRDEHHNNLIHFFEEHRKLQPSYLKQKYSDQYSYLSKAGQEAFERFFLNHIQTQKDSRYISTFLALDAHYKVDWHKELRSYRDARVFADFYHSLKDGIGAVQTRGLQYVWANICEMMIERKLWNGLNRTETQLRAELLEASAALDLKTREDLLDTEMLQFLVTGKMHNGEFAPVYVYTMEEEQKFLKRLAILKTLSNYIWETTKDMGAPLPAFHQGTIIFVTSTGHISSIVSVDSITRECKKFCVNRQV